MAKAFGLEVTRYEVRLACLEGTAKRLVLQDFVRTPIEFDESEDEDAFSPGVRDHCHEGRVQGDQRLP